MPNLIDQSFFVRDITIPNTTNPAILERLISFIDKFEPRCLDIAFGYNFYKLYQTETSQRMTDILDGAEFVNRFGVTQKWVGLVHDTDQSLIAYYVYYYFQKDSISQTTGVATVVSKKEASINISPAEKMISAWNQFARESNSLISFLRSKKDIDDVFVYPEFTYYQAYLSSRGVKTNNIFGF